MHAVIGSRWWWGGISLYIMVYRWLVMKIMVNVLYRLFYRPLQMHCIVLYRPLQSQHIYVRGSSIPYWYVISCCVIPVVNGQTVKSQVVERVRCLDKKLIIGSP